VHADAIAMHYKAATTKGHTRTLVGSYSIGAIRTAAGRRIDRFAFHLKFMDGKLDLSCVDRASQPWSSGKTPVIR
jgi:hypothetical protein